LLLHHNTQPLMALQYILQLIASFLFVQLVHNGQLDKTILKLLHIKHLILNAMNSVIQSLQLRQ
jgi:hypothetical protein